MDLSSKQKGCLLGLAVGDALGATNEFTNPKNVPPFPNLMTGPQTDIIGGGPFKLVKGQVTDDTHMAICLARTMKENGHYELYVAAYKYRAWIDYSIANNFDGGTTTIGSLKNLSITSPEFSGYKFWMDNKMQPAGNGSLMRIAPLAVYSPKDDPSYIDNCFYDSAITHFDFRCQIANASFISAIRSSLYANADKKMMLEVANNALTLSDQILETRFPKMKDNIEQAIRELHSDLKAATNSNPDVYGQDINMVRRMGYVRVAYRLAFWYLMNAPSYSAALIDVINRGGDSDTNGAIVGALLGSFYGIEGIPKEWIDTVVNCVPPKEWKGYHPKDLL